MRLGKYVFNHKGHKGRRAPGHGNVLNRGVRGAALCAYAEGTLRTQCALINISLVPSASSAHSAVKVVPLIHCGYIVPE